MRLGATAFVINGLEIEEYEVITVISNSKFRVLNKKGKSILIDKNTFESDIFYSKIIAYTTLEERLLFSLTRTREFIRRHRQKFNTTVSLKEFTKVTTKVTEEEIQKEITTTGYEEIYSEDKLTDEQ